MLSNNYSNSGLQYTTAPSPPQQGSKCMAYKQQLDHLYCESTKIPFHLLGCSLCQCQHKSQSPQPAQMGGVSDTCAIADQQFTGNLQQSQCSKIHGYNNNKRHAEK